MLTAVGSDRSLYRDRPLHSITCIRGNIAYSMDVPAQDFFYFLILSRTLIDRLAPVLKTYFHQCVISYTCSQSNSDGSVLKQSHQG